MDIGTRETITLEERPRTRRSRLVVGLLSVLLLAGIGAAIWLWPARKGTQTKPDRWANAPVPVLVAAATQRDVPIWLDALGTVQAYSTVTVKPMVDGPLIEVDFKEGQEVRRGDVLARIDPRTYQAAFDQAVAKKAQDEAQLANAKVDLARYQKLVQNNYTTAQQADTQKATVAQLTAQISSDQAAIDNARTLLGYTTITSPIDGRAGIRQVDAGNIVHATDTTGLLVLTQLRPISVLFNLPQQDLSQIATAMRGPSPPLVLAMNETGPDSGAVLDRGQLAVLDNQVDPTTGTIKLKATFPNQNETLWPGGFVRVRLQVATARDAVTVPPSAVQRGPNGDYVYIVKPDHTALRQPVKVAHQDADAAILAGGVQPGQQVVTDGAARLSDGKAVTIAPAPGEPAPETAKPAGTHTGQHRRHPA
ncbi:MAG: efflux RND transporter periplasmic adaptor subunit [Acetobacteraceae bacterium]|nr:efflux RND transporter periplasmic adaptor subunit [Acetobacteraceae bacterium]